MKLIIAGSRIFEFDHDFIYEAILAAIGKYKKFPKIDQVVSGGADGIDTAAKNYAEAWEVPFKEFPAAWTDLSHPDAVIRTRKDGTKYDALAGYRRNQQMAEYADALLLIWDGKSGGSKNMRQQILMLNKPIYEMIIK